ncbi:glycosyltransferase family 2 protein [Thioalkalivibrio versutus]|uniref:glycosyltransferase family 2 protein n=1 Tax=Thioalkalivibrio versutus TaxID=106634 RepID=UPI000399C0B6|nr:glycosyltransferase family 2 protein [Thioalkalivibrio versutus]OOC48232.1 glycosyl transferase [Thioalkalivibrio versutus]
MQPQLSVVIPAKNEAQAIGPVVKKILELYPKIEILVVNDGSTDNTAEIAEKAGARVISHPYSMGNGAAIKHGARVAEGRKIVFMDADGQHDPSDIPRLLEQIDNGFDMAVGARQSSSQASILRGVANRFYNRLASYMTGHRIDDLTSGFRAARSEKFREFLSLLPNGFSYPTTSTMAFFRAGYPVAYVPITASPRIGTSHIRLVKDGTRFLLIIFRIGTLYSPLKLFVPVSLSFFLVGLGYYLFTLITAGRFTNMSALLLTTSVIIFLIGLVSEQITQLMYKGTGTEEARPPTIAPGSTTHEQ